MAAPEFDCFIELFGLNNFLFFSEDFLYSPCGPESWSAKRHPLARLRPPPSPSSTRLAMITRSKSNKLRFNLSKGRTHYVVAFYSKTFPFSYLQGDTSILRNVADKLPDPIGWRKWKVGDWFGNIEKDRTPIPVSKYCFDLNSAFLHTVHS